MNNKLDSEHTLTSRIDNAVSFVPNDDSQLAIVPLSMLMQLASRLKNGSQSNIIRDFKLALGNIRYDDNALELAVVLAQEFVDFHKTVNLIEKYSIENGKVIEETLEGAEPMH